MPKIIACGCSITYGHGLADISIPDKKGMIDYSKGPSSAAWPNLVAGKLKFECVNLAMPAASNKRIAHSITTLDKIKKSDIVIFAWTYLLRSAIFYPGGKELFLHTHTNPRKENHKPSQEWVSWRAKYTNDDYDLMQDNLAWISFANRYALSKTRNVFNFSVFGGFPKELQQKYLVNILEDWQKKIIIPCEKALDGSHPGDKAHRLIADKVLHYIDETQQ